MINAGCLLPIFELLFAYFDHIILKYHSQSPKLAAIVRNISLVYKRNTFILGCFELNMLLLNIFYVILMSIALHNDGISRFSKSWNV